MHGDNVIMIIVNDLCLQCTYMVNHSVDFVNVKLWNMEMFSRISHNNTNSLLRLCSFSFSVFFLYIYILKDVFFKPTGDLQTCALQTGYRYHCASYSEIICSISWWDWLESGVKAVCCCFTITYYALFKWSVDHDRNYHQSHYNDWDQC